MSEEEVQQLMGRLFHAQTEAKKQAAQWSARVKEVAHAYSEFARAMVVQGQVLSDPGNPERLVVRRFHETLRDLGQHLLTEPQLAELLRSRDDAHRKLAGLNKDLAELGVRMEGASE